MTKGETQYAPQIPSDIESEGILIGMLLREPHMVQYVDLDPADFFLGVFQKIYSIIMDYYSNREVATIGDIHTRLQNDRDFLNHGGYQFLEQLYTNALPAIHPEVVQRLANKIKRLAVLRRIISIGAEMTTMAHALNDPEKIIEQVESKLRRVKLSKSNIIKDVQFPKLRIILSNPRAYYLTVEPPGKEIVLTIQEIRNPKTVQMIIQNTFDFIPRMPKNWLDVINELLANAERVEPPKEAIFEYRVKKAMVEFFGQMSEGYTVEDLRAPMYTIKTMGDVEYRCFFVRPLLKYLDTVEKIKLTALDLWNIVAKWGCLKDKRIRLDKTTTVWAIPEQIFQEFESEEEETTEDTTEKTTEGYTKHDTTSDTTEQTTEDTTEDTTEEGKEDTTEDTTEDFDWLFSEEEEEVDLDDIFGDTTN